MGLSLMHKLTIGDRTRWIQWDDPDKVWGDTFEGTIVAGPDERGAYQWRWDKKPDITSLWYEPKSMVMIRAKYVEDGPITYAT